MYEYSDITVIIKTFIRPKVCIKTIKAWNVLYPNINIIVVDDGDINPDLTEYKNVRHIKTEFNIGLSAGRNLGVKNADTKFIFIADDDDIPIKSNHNIVKCKNLLLELDIDLIGSNAFQAHINNINNNGIVQQLYIPSSPGYIPCDVTTNHFLIKNQNVPIWPENIKIKREHYIFFQRCKENNLKIAGTNFLQFKSQRIYPKRYSKYKSVSYNRIIKDNYGINKVIWKYLRGKKIIE